jgi:hypothetical protein
MRWVLPGKGITNNIYWKSKPVAADADAFRRPSISEVEGGVVGPFIEIFEPPFKHRMPTRAAAVRELLRLGLSVGGTNGDGQKSSNYGVVE